MKRLRYKFFAILMLIACLAVQSTAFDRGRLIKSIAFPGMGQLGDGQTIKGLSFMGAEIVFLTLMFENMSHISSQQIETERLSVLYKMGGDYAEIQKIHRAWQDAYDKYENSVTYTIGFAGLAALCYGLNIADALLFPPKNPDNVSLVHTIARNTTVAANGTSARITCTIGF
ncbi:MAG: hypothetical protein GF350_07355 [Chitinivibrionales bacterium]|nr:hypothetical protein [Chitinivibrionales bacterium]